jgi:hypothetical protein
MTSQNDIKLGENSIADRAIFIGRGHNVYNAIGNRRFRKLVDMFVQEYVECSNRSHKSGLVRTIIEVSEKAGYRFLQQDESGVLRELSYEQKKKKVSAGDQHLVISSTSDPFVRFLFCA